MTTPLTVQLPFNRDILGRDFTPAKRGGKPAGARGHWILAHEQNLLVVAEADSFRLPYGDCPLALNGAEENGHHGHPDQSASEVDEIAEAIRTAKLKAELFGRQTTIARAACSCVGWSEVAAP